jgi:hypothetical protein
MPQKSDGPVLDSGGSGFLRTDRVRLGFDIYFIYERFTRVGVKELCHVAYINIGHGRIPDNQKNTIYFYLTFYHSCIYFYLSFYHSFLLFLLFVD